MQEVKNKMMIDLNIYHHLSKECNLAEEMSFLRFKNVMDYIDFGRTTETRTIAFYLAVNHVKEIVRKL